MSRAAVWKLLTQSQELNSLGYSADNSYGNRTVDSFKKGEPFMVLVWGESSLSNVPVPLEVQVQELRVWIHEPKYSSNTFVRIDEALAVVKSLMSEAVHVEGSDGRVLSHADWRGDSPDLTDDTLNTITKHSTFRVVHRKAN